MPEETHSNFTTQQMKAVVSIARCRSFMAAAEELNISQSSLTRIIQGLEEHLGATLFARSTRRVELTPEGEEFVAVAQRVLNDLGITLRRMRDLSDQKRGQVIVSTLMSVAQGLLPPILADYRSQHAAIEVHVREGLEKEIEEDLRSGISDFAIASMARIPETFRAVPLRREHFKVILPKRHLLATLDCVSLKDLEGLELISLPLGARTRQIVDAAAGAAGVRLNHHMTARQLATIYAMVRQGLGVAVLPECVVAGLGSTGVVVAPLSQPELYRDLSLVFLAERPLSPAAQGLMELVEERASS